MDKFTPSNIKLNPEAPEQSLQNNVDFITPKEAYFIVKKSQREIVAKLMEENFKSGKNFIKLPFKLLDPIALELKNKGWCIGNLNDSIYWPDSTANECEKELLNAEIKK